MPDKKNKIKLLVEKRKLTGRKVKLLRKDSVLPANIYGRNVKSLAVQVGLKSFLLVLKEAGETGLVELKVKGEDKARPVLIHNIQYHSINDQLLHVDFYQVDLKKKVTAKISVELVGESPAVRSKVGILIQPLNEIEVEALPIDLPEKIEVDISKLENIDDAVLVSDVKLEKAIKILTDATQVLVKIDPLAKEEEVAPVEESKEEGEEGEAAEEGKEVPEGGEEKKEEGKGAGEGKEQEKKKEKSKEG